MNRARGCLGVRLLSATAVIGQWSASSPPKFALTLRGCWDGCRAAGRADSPMLVALAAPGCSSTARRALCAVMALAATPPQPGGVGTRTLGVDFGLRRVGLALSGGFAPLPLNVLPCDDDDAAMTRNSSELQRNRCHTSMTVSIIWDRGAAAAAAAEIQRCLLTKLR